MSAPVRARDCSDPELYRPGPMPKHRRVDGSPIPAQRFERMGIMLPQTNRSGEAREPGQEEGRSSLTADRS
ncbi:hypothetical protein GCM10027447_06200 [Glycomyces halotolerans]